MQSKKVVFPSDLDKSLTAPGDVVVSNIHRPITLAEFNRLDLGAKKHYIQWCVDTFNASDSAIGEMFGVAQSTVFSMRKRFGIEIDKHRHMSQEENYAWKAFLREKKPMIEPQKEEPKPVALEQEPSQAMQIAMVALEALIEDVRKKAFEEGYTKALNDISNAVEAKR